MSGCWIEPKREFELQYGYACFIPYRPLERERVFGNSKLVEQAQVQALYLPTGASSSARTRRE